ncbi:hypothetical protein FKW77_001748 [Venturia effusa]|uniref:DUF7918 domain-containing protein n=1 Tax=Venturia effusa TaxID=50376 RepID=A0A517LM98_9PEZI|nr:hypothetical protein FKW77_001748 [Venturia effusa]
MDQGPTEGDSKMLHPDGLEVYIKSLDRDEPYVEYTKPDNSEVADSKSKERYIEVVPGERFSVVIKIKKDFDCHDQPWIRSGVFIDNGTVNTESNRRTDFAKISDLTLEISNSYQCIEGKWFVAGSSFAELTLDEDLVHEDSTLSSLEETLGRIRVVIALGRVVNLPKPVPCSRHEPTSSTSKQLYMDSGITSGMKPVLADTKEICPPSRTTRFERKSRSLDYKFEFFYRSGMTLERFGIKPISPTLTPILANLSPEDVNPEASEEYPVAIGLGSESIEDSEPDPGSDDGQMDTAADAQAKLDGQMKVNGIEKTLGAEARKRTKFSLESYKDSDVEFCRAGMDLQLAPDSQNTSFSLSSLNDPALVSTAIDTRRFRHIQWCPYECNLIRLNGVQDGSKASVTRDLKFTTRQEAELFMVRMMQMTAPIFIARTSQRMIKLFMNFPAERMPVCRGPEPNKPLAQGRAVPAAANRPRLPLPTSPASTTSVPTFESIATPASDVSQQMKRKTMEENVTDDEEYATSETPSKMSKQARIEPSAAATSTVMSPPPSELSDSPMSQTVEHTSAQADTAANNATLPTPSPEAPATPVSQPEESPTVLPEAIEAQTLPPPQNDIVDLTADDDDVPVKVKSSETRATPKQENGKGRAGRSESRAMPDDDDDIEKMSMEDIMDEMKLTDRMIKLRATLRRRQRG